MGKPTNNPNAPTGAAAHPAAPDGVQFIEGGFEASGMLLAIVVARFNQQITGRLLDSALTEAARLGLPGDRITVAYVPGSLELATAARAFVDDHFDAIVCLGCVIRGETDHYDAVVQGARQGITQLTVETGVPVIFGVLTCDNEQQAMERSEAGGERDTGTYAVRAAIEMANLRRRINP